MESPTSKPVSPCMKDCPDRGCGCSRTCTHGIKEYESAKQKYYVDKKKFYDYAYGYY